MNKNENETLTTEQNFIYERLLNITDNSNYIESLMTNNIPTSFETFEKNPLLFEEYEYLDEALGFSISEDKLLLFELLSILKERYYNRKHNNEFNNVIDNSCVAIGSNLKIDYTNDIEKQQQRYLNSNVKTSNQLKEIAIRISQMPNSFETDEGPKLS